MPLIVKRGRQRRPARIWRDGEPQLPAEYIEKVATAGPMARARESGIEAAIVGLLDAAGIIHTKSKAERVLDERTGRYRTRVRKGWPDRTCTLPTEPVGWSLYIEAKAGGWGRLSDDQKTICGQLHASGALVIVPRSAKFVAAVIERECMKRLTPEQRDTPRMWRVLQVCREAQR